MPASFDVDHVRARARHWSPLLAWVAAGTVAVLVAFAIPDRPWGMDSHTFWSVTLDPDAYALPPGVTGAWLYSPAAAQAFQLVTWMPWPVFAVVWPIAAVAAYVWLVVPAGWVWGVPLLFLAVEDITVGNCTWVMALCIVAGLRASAAWVAPALTKVALGIGLMWFIGRRDWRSVAVAAAVGLAVVAVSWTLSPDMWVAWLKFIGEHSTTAATVRLGIGAGLMVIAGISGRVEVVPVALIVASPVPALYSLGLLCTLPRLLHQHGQGPGSTVPVTEAKSPTDEHR